MEALFTRCARPFCDDQQYQLIQQAAQSFCHWETLTEQAETHALGPLLYHHLKHAGITPPQTVSTQLKLVYLRHRRAYQLRQTILRDILDAFMQAGIKVIVLKGGALCHLIYPDPALRPMRDLDLLVKPEDALKAQQLLKQLGFTAPEPIPGKRWLSHQLPEAQIRKEGLTITIEIHYDVFTKVHPISMPWQAIKRPLLAFPCADGTAFTLGYEDMLRHLCHHLITLGEPVRLIAVADIIGFAEKFADEIDWQWLRKHYPFVLNTLSLLGLITPLSEPFQQRLGLKVDKLPTGIGVDYHGWPHTSYCHVRAHRHGLWHLLVDSLSASQWWLRLHYGLDDHQSLLFCRAVTHPARLTKIMLKRLLWRI